MDKAHELLIKMKIVEEYGDAYHNPDGSVKHYLYTWDDGHRYLQQCRSCGAYFLVQVSEFHSFSGPDDSDYIDWYQVEDEGKAELLNRNLNGWQLESDYDAPHFFMTNDEFRGSK
jgi:hypothetical protein